MNSILSKCISELKVDNPRIDYVLGMLETLLDMQGSVSVKETLPNQQISVISNYDEKSVMEAGVAAAAQALAASSQIE